MRTLSIVSVLAALASLSGCCRLPRPETGPSSTEELLGAVREQSLSLATIRGELRVDHMGPAGRVAGKVYAFAASGGRLRLEAVSPMETPIRVVAVDAAGGTFTMTDQDEQRCVEGAAEPCLVGDAIGIEMSAAHVGATLVGSAPLLRHSSATSSWNRCGYWELTLTGEQQGWRETLRLAPEDGAVVITRAEITGPEGVVVLIEHEGHRRQGRLVLPRRSRIRTPISEGDLVVDWRSVEVDVDLPDGAWRARCPDGFAAETASCTSAGSLPLLEEVTPPETDGPDGTEEGGTEEGGTEEGGTEEPGGDLSEELGL